MKELKLDNIIPVEAITSRLWSVFDVLINEPVSSEDYHLILFLLNLLFNFLKPLMLKY